MRACNSQLADIKERLEDPDEAIKYPHRTLTQFIKSYKAGRARLAKLKT